MSRGGIAVLIVAALVFAGLGFVFGQVVQAANNTPANLVTEDYVHQYVGRMLTEMQTKVDSLEMRIHELTGSGAGSATIPEPPNNGSSTTPTTPTTPATPTPTTVKIKADVSSANVRADASETASIVGSASANTVLTYLGVKKNDSQGRAWYNVRLSNGTEGWVASWVCNEPQ